MEFKKKDLIENTQPLNEDAIENVLMIAGFVPVIGEIADLILIIRYIKKREYLYAAIMLIALIPTVGDFIAKPFIRVLKGSGSAGKVAMSSGEKMAEYLMKNPKIKEQYLKLAKHFDDPKVISTINGVSKVNSSWGAGIGKSIQEAKSVVGKLKPARMAARVGKEVAAGGKISRGLKSFFQEERLAQYVAKKGMKPSNWVSNWWNVIRKGRQDRRNMFRSVILSSKMLDNLGLPNLSMSELDSKMGDPKFREMISNDPTVSNYIDNNTSQDELSQIEGSSNKSEPSSLLGGMASLGVLKMLAKMYT